MPTQIARFVSRPSGADRRVQVQGPCGQALGTSIYHMRRASRPINSTSIRVAHLDSEDGARVSARGHGHHQSQARADCCRMQETGIIDRGNVRGVHQGQWHWLRPKHKASTCRTASDRAPPLALRPRLGVVLVEVGLVALATQLAVPLIILGEDGDGRGIGGWLCYSARCITGTLAARAAGLVAATQRPCWDGAPAGAFGKGGEGAGGAVQLARQGWQKTHRLADWYAGRRDFQQAR